MSDESYRQVRSGLAAGLILLISVTVAVASPRDGATGDADEKAPVTTGVYQSAPVTPYRFDGNARDLPPPRRWKLGDPVREIPLRAYPHPSQQKDDRRAANQGVDPLLRLQQLAPQAESTRAFGTADRNFNGQGFSGVNPPDTVGDVGPNHYVQMINGLAGATVRIYDKALPTPNVLANFTLDALGSGFCATGSGDPIVIYDRFADRWMLSEFSSSGNNLCMYISQTTDPTGSYFVYGFAAPTFPDYPKYAAWPTDATGGQGSYIVTTNEASPDSGVFAMDRGAMLAGAAATFQRFVISDLPGFPLGAATPADLDGPNQPPVGTPAVIMRHRDTEAHSGPAAPEDVLEMWHFDVDWLNSANTTFTQLTDLDVAEFESDLCGLLSRFCFPQPGTGTTLDPLLPFIMNRLQYLNFNDHETLVGNFVTDVDGTDHGGLRWFELRRVGGDAAPWTLHQEGTYAPNADHRWMAASAMDQSGNIAIGYNVSSTSTFPSLRYTGRLADDALSTMTQGETSIVAGSASNSSNRYGDYSGMNLDPEDDCTFWFTGEYNASGNWSTRIASFRFDACGCDLFPLPLGISGGVGGPNQVDLSWNDSELVDVIEYRVMRSRTTGGPYTTVDTVVDTSPGAGNGAAYNYSDTTVNGGIDYYYIVRASDGGACISDPSNELTVTATGSCTLPPLFGGLETVETPNTGICTLNSTWSAATPECAGPISYEIYRSTTAGFTPGPGNLLATTMATAHSDVDLLVTGVEYFYIVRAIDDSNSASETNTVEVSGIPLGAVAPPIFTDDGGDSGPAQLTATGPWSVQAGGGNNGPGVYTTGDYGDNTRADLVTPSIMLGFGNTLSFWSSYDIEFGWDKGEVQISTDGGGSWTRIEVGYPASSIRNSDACGLPAGDYFTGTGTAWNQFVADLSPWDGQTVIIRWLMSTDGSVTRTLGWNIDDIEVGNNAAACVTASPCADNPFVDVSPEGPQTVCQDGGPALTANLTGGTGPFHYQWLRDGLPVSGATGPEYTPNDLGTYAYNVRVRADACPNEVVDGASTELTRVNRPFFNGIESALNPQNPTCTVDLAWNAATSACPGPIEYVIYRDTTGPVAQVPGNIIAGGLSGTSYSDVEDLLNDQVYFYNVQARDASTGQFDGNTVDAVATPDGPNDGINNHYVERFTDAMVLNDWTITTGPGPHNCGEWAIGSDPLKAPVQSSGNYLIADNDCAPLLPQTSTTATSPAIDLVIAGLQSVTLKVNARFDYSSVNTVETGAIEVWDGTQWIALWNSTTADVNLQMSFDVTAHAANNPSFMVRFDYQDANLDNYFSVDDVVVITDVMSVCATEAAGPLPIAAGSLTVGRAAGASMAVDVAWGATSCPTVDYNLLYGDLDDVATCGLLSSECSIGTSGSFSWTGVPGGNLYFLLVGTDGANTESSWGRNSGFVERNGSAASNQCGISVKDTTGVCP